MFGIRSRLRNLLLKALLVPVNIAVRHLNGNLKSEYTKLVLKSMENASECFCTLKKRLKSSENMVLNETESEINALSAIIMQGPLVAENDFTLETVRFYQKMYPGVHVIVSTWNNENQDLLRRLCEEKGCVVVQSSYPAHSGLLNLNYQAVTTMAGLKKGKELGVQYVFKTRTDYRFYKKGLITYLYSLLQAFPLAEDEGMQKCRIVAGGEIMNSMYRPYWLADQFNYGYIDDMMLYWDYPLDDIDIDKRMVSEILSESHMTWKERTDRKLAAEPELVKNFIERILGDGKSEYENTVKCYWKLLKDRFIVVSRQDLEFYWYKYFGKYDESFAEGNYYIADSREKALTYNWDFCRWLSLYMGNLAYEEKYESYCENNRY